MVNAYIVRGCERASVLFLPIPLIWREQISVCRVADYGWRPRSEGKAYQPNRCVDERSITTGSEKKTAAHIDRQIERKFSGIEAMAFFCAAAAVSEREWMHLNEVN